MNYQETLDWLFSQLPMFQRKGQAAYKANLDNTLELDRYFSYPHKKFKTIHVAGTNGKGSVSHLMASVLQSAGYKTALYTSPHLKDFRERIKINGEPVSKEFVVDFIEKHKDKFGEIKPSFFEMTVAMAFQYFAEQQVDYAIIETGLGGRLDSTNIITPEISIITNVSLDHTALLGDCVTKIAPEKAGIIKKDIPVVIGEYDKETAGIFIDKAKQEGTDLVFADQLYSLMDSKYENNKRRLCVESAVEKEKVELVSGLSGIYQSKNVVTALVALEKLKNKGLDITDKDIAIGFEKVVENTGIMGRWQILGTQPLVVCDTGHNEAGIKCVLEQINEVEYNNLHVVFGMVNDKSIDTVLSMMPANATYYFTKASIPRALPEKELQKKAINFGLKGECYETVHEALEKAQEMAKNDDLVFVGGSTFIVAEVV
jgi:dihydrofolate synthase/folylpolyglutamate synthase